MFSALGSCCPEQKLTPFADDSASVSVGKLTVENGVDQIALYGSLDLTRDKHGLAQAFALKAVVDSIVQHLQAENDLPDALPSVQDPKICAEPV